MGQREIPPGFARERNLTAMRMTGKRKWNAMVRGRRERLWIVRQQEMSVRVANMIDLSPTALGSSRPVNTRDVQPFPIESDGTTRISEHRDARIDRHVRKRGGTIQLIMVSQNQI